ncbi:RusA family crossover junction endodeoxyribonuclease [Alteribacillus sp. HJP-4]
MYIFLCGGNQGDIDNYAKSITDGLNRIAYKDDRPIQSMP